MESAAIKCLNDTVTFLKFLNIVLIILKDVIFILIFNFIYLMSTLHKLLRLLQGYSESDIQMGYIKWFNKNILTKWNIQCIHITTLIPRTQPEGVFLIIDIVIPYHKTTSKSMYSIVQKYICIRIPINDADDKWTD